MFTNPRLIIACVVALALVAGGGWIKHQSATVAALRKDNDALTFSLNQAEATATSLRTTLAAQTRRIEKLEEDARKADALRKQIEETNDQTPIPDWLRNLPGLLRQ